MLGAILGGASILGSLLGRGSQGAQQERAQQNQFAQGQQNNQQNALLAALAMQERAQLDRARLGMEAPNARMRQALLGSLIQNAQAARVQPPPGIRMGTISGGLTPAAINQFARMGGGEMQRQGLQALYTGSDVPAQPNYAQSAVLPPAQYQQAGRGESLMAGGGLLASLLGALGPLLANRGGGRDIHQGLG